MNRRLLKEDGEGRNIINWAVHQTFIVGGSSSQAELGQQKTNGAQEEA